MRLFGFDSTIRKQLADKEEDAISIKSKEIKTGWCMCLIYLYIVMILYLL